MTLPDKAALPIVMTIVANASYSLCAKLMSRANPLVSLMATYLIALLLCMVLFFAFYPASSFRTELRQITSPSLVLGGVVVLLECGFVLAFRAGWNLGYASLFSNAVATIVLLPVSIILFQGAITARTLVGIATTLGGLYLILA